MEAALTAALAAAGLPLAAVATAVLAYRLVSFWGRGGRRVGLFVFLRRGNRLRRQAQDWLSSAGRGW